MTLDKTPNVYEQAKERARDDLTRTELTNMLYDFPNVIECLVDGEDEDWRKTTITVGFGDDGYRDTQHVTKVMRRAGYEFHKAVFSPYNRLTFVEKEHEGTDDGWIQDDDGNYVPRQSEPADFGGGESTGVQDL